MQFETPLHLRKLTIARHKENEREHGLYCLDFTISYVLIEFSEEPLQISFTSGDPRGNRSEVHLERLIDCWAALT